MKLFDLPDNKCYIWGQPNEYNKDRDQVQVIGYQRIAPGESYPKEGFPDNCLFKEHGGRCINDFQLIYINSGTGILQDRGIRYEVHAGHFIMILPGLWHSYAPRTDTGWEEYYIGFNGPELSRLAREISQINTIVLLEVNNSDFVLPLFLTALHIGEEENEENEIIIKALLTEMLMKIRYSLNNNDESKQSLLYKTRYYMETHLKEKIRNDDIARHLCVSTSWFRKEFYKQTGVPPATFLSRIRLQTSKYMLLSSDKSVKEISYECGFSTSEYFCKYFKDSTGLTPSEFRARRPSE